MAKKQSETNLYLLSIVAIVGIVVLILQDNGINGVSSEDVAGEAFKISSSGLKVPSTGVTETSSTSGYGNKQLCNPKCGEGETCVDNQCVEV